MLIASAPYPASELGALAPYAGQVATRSFVPSDRSATNMQFMGRTMHVARQAISELQVAYAAWSIDTASTGQERASTAALSIKCSVEYDGAIVGIIQWAGAATGNIPAGETLLSDVCELVETIPAGATFYLRPYVVSSSAGVPYTTSGGTGDGIFAAGESCNQGTAGIADLTAETGPFAGNSTKQNIYPVAIVATTSKPSFYLAGDSRMVGSRGTPNAAGDVGEAAISIGPSFAYINAGTGGDSAFWFSRYHARRLELAKYCSHVVVGFPINDVRSGGRARTFAQAQSDMRNLWSLFAGKPIIQLTCAPWTTSTDNWATVANQTKDAGDPARIAWNAYVRTAPAPLAAACDLCTVLESGPDSGFWIPGYTGEGGHPNNAGYAAIGASAIIDAAALASEVKVEQIWNPYGLFPKVVGSGAGEWLVADEATCTGAGNEIFKAKNNEGAWTQATVAKKPVLEAGIINGRAAWRFTAANLQEAAGSTTTRNLTNGQPGALIAVVIRMGAPTGANQQIVNNSRGNSANSNRFGLIVDSTGKVNTAVRRLDTDAGAGLIGSTVLAEGGDYIILSQVDLTNNSGILRVNGADEATTGTAAPAASAGNWPATNSTATILGAINGSLYFNGWLAELVEVPGIQSLADIQKLEGRLASLYAIPLPAGHPYKDGPPTV